MDEGLAPLSLTQSDSGQWTLQPGWQVTQDIPYYPAHQWPEPHLEVAWSGALPGGTSACWCPASSPPGLAQDAMMLAGRSPELRHQVLKEEPQPNGGK